MQAIEYMDLASMDMVRDMNAQTVYPFDQDYKHYVVIEVAQTVDPLEGGGSNSDSSDYSTDSGLDTDRLFNFFETIEENILVSAYLDHRIGQSLTCCCPLCSLPRYAIALESNARCLGWRRFDCI